MSVEVFCPKCKRRYNVRSYYLGKKFLCQYCGNTISVPKMGDMSIDFKKDFIKKGKQAAILGNIALAAAVILQIFFGQFFWAGIGCYVLALIAAGVMLYRRRIVNGSIVLTASLLFPLLIMIIKMLMKSA